MILLDTNLLTRVADPAHPHCVIARRAIHLLSARDERLVVVPQNLYEFWAVATRKRGRPPVGQNGLGMRVKQASQWLDFFQRRFTVLMDREDLFARWRMLVEMKGVQGYQSYDVRLVAAMLTYGVTQVLTFNIKDFRDVSVTVIDPASL